MSDSKRTSTKIKSQKKNSEKKLKFDNDKKKKDLDEQIKKQEKKEEQHKRLETYINESGLTLAFNIIFSELITKRIVPEYFFSYTSMRLKQIGKEIEAMKINIPSNNDITNIDNIDNQNKNDEINNNNNNDDSILITQQKMK